MFLQKNQLNKKKKIKIMKFFFILFYFILIARITTLDNIKYENIKNIIKI